MQMGEKSRKEVRVEQLPYQSQEDYEAEGRVCFRAGSAVRVPQEQCPAVNVHGAVPYADDNMEGI